MLDVTGGCVSQCDGQSRREMLRIGALAIGGLTLPGLLARKAQARSAGKDPTDLAVIHIFMGGGPSHIDMYDLKPDAPREIRGEFRGIPTTLPGIRFCEHLPLLARTTDRLAIVRSITHTNSAHLPSSHLVLTGYEPAVAPPYGHNLNPYPGAVFARLRGPNAPGLPPYVALHRKISYGGAAFLGQAYEPFDTGAKPEDDGFEVHDLNRLPSIPAERLASREGLVGEFDRMRRDLDVYGDMEAVDAYFKEAMALVTSERAARAFDIEREPTAVRERYGRTSLGQNCLLARRLVEAGVTFVSCRTGLAFDTHEKNFPQMREILPVFDRAVSALVNDIYERGLAERVLVTAFGEFGRTPRINSVGGRDHWPGAAAALFAGGGIKVGQVIGTTDAQAAFPTSSPYTPRDVLATLYHLMGVDSAQVFHDQQGRPMPILPDGKPIRELL